MALRGFDNMQKEAEELLPMNCSKKDVKTIFLLICEIIEKQ